MLKTHEYTRMIHEYARIFVYVREYTRMTHEFSRIFEYIRAYIRANSRDLKIRVNSQNILTKKLKKINNF